MSLNGGHNHLVDIYEDDACLRIPNSRIVQKTIFNTKTFMKFTQL